MVLRFNLALSLAFLFFGCADIERDSPYDPKSRDYAFPPVSYGTLSYQGQTYRTVKIGGQTWMADNLNYNASGSVCYGNESSNCATYGRLYDWATAMDLDPSCNFSACASQVQSTHRGICPSGWHIPSNEDWDKLYRYADGTSGTSSPYDSPTASKHLKAKTDWSYCGPSGSGSSYSCEDTYGFSALPGGFGSSGGSFYSVGAYGSWWSSSSEGNSYYAYYRYMNYLIEDANWNNGDKTFLFSVRCLQD